MTERELLEDCLHRLNASGLPYKLGSMASNIWGIPRTTHDLDFVVQLEAASIRNMVQSFESDYYIQAASVEAALRPPYQFNALDNRSALKVDFWVLRPDPFEQVMFSRRKEMPLFGTREVIATAEDISTAQTSLASDHAFGATVARRFWNLGIATRFAGSEVLDGMGHDAES